MVALLDLWLPVLLSAVLVFVASSILHMVLPLHRKDYGKLPAEAEVTAHLRAQGIGPGEYMFPHAGSMKEMGSPEMIEKMERGPVGLLTVLPSGPPAIGKNLVQWFLYSLVISVFVGYVASLAFGPGAEYMAVFRQTGTVAVLGYALASVPNSIWKGVRWSVTAKFVLDGVVYALLTAGAFASLWPAAL